MNNVLFKREQVRQLVKNFNTTITFIKADGTERVMRGTLNPSRIPIDEFIDDDWNEISNPNKNENVLAVWDLEKNAWRSFRLDSIKNISISPGE